jgi:HK97 gp10 family phage protein
MTPKLTITGVGDLRKKLEKVIGAAMSDQHVGQALKAGAEVFGEAIEGAVPRGSGNRNKRHKGRTIRPIISSIKKAQRGRTTPRGPCYFAAIDRKLSPQARFYYSGTKHQKARPEALDSAIKGARARARQAIVNRLLRIAWDHL